MAGPARRGLDNIAMMAVSRHVCSQFDLIRKLPGSTTCLPVPTQLDLPVPHATGGAVLALGVGDHFRLEGAIGDEEDVARLAALARLDAGEVVMVQPGRPST